MEKISFDGENYVKASVIARELGYTADYVGQLCRSEKVPAQLVGRTWYVSEQALHSHKKNRYRKSTEKSKNEVRKTVSEMKAVSKVLPQRIHPLFYKRIVPPPSYENDDSELIPVLSSKEPSRAIPTPPMRKINDSIQSAPRKPLMPGIRAKRPNMKMSGMLSVSGEDTLGNELKLTSVSRRSALAVSKKKLHKSAMKPADKQKKLSSAVKQAESVQTSNKYTNKTSTLNRWGVIFSFIAIFAIALVLIFVIASIEQQIFSSADSLQENYNLDIKSVIELLKNVLK